MSIRMYMDMEVKTDFYLFLSVCFLSYAHKRNRDTNKKRNAFSLTSEDKQRKFFRKVDKYILISIYYVCCEQDINNIMHINAGRRTTRVSLC